MDKRVLLIFKPSGRLDPVYKGSTNDGSPLVFGPNEIKGVDPETAKRLKKDFPKHFKEVKSEKKEIKKPPVDKQVKSSTTKNK